MLLAFNGIFGNIVNVILYTFKFNSLYCILGFLILMETSIIAILFYLPDISDYDPLKQINDEGEL